MSARAARVQRRAQQRAREREILRHVLAGADHGAAPCIAPGCGRRGPVVTIGGIHITLCHEHKRAFDAAWSAAGRKRAA